MEEAGDAGGDSASKISLSAGSKVIKDPIMIWNKQVLTDEELQSQNWIKLFGHVSNVSFHFISMLSATFNTGSNINIVAFNHILSANLLLNSSNVKGIFVFDTQVKKFKVEEIVKSSKISDRILFVDGNISDTCHRNKTIIDTTTIGSSTACISFKEVLVQAEHAVRGVTSSAGKVRIRPHVLLVEDDSGSLQAIQSMFHEDMGKRRPALLVAYYTKDLHMITTFVKLLSSKGYAAGSLVDGGFAVLKPKVKKQKKRSRSRDSALLG